LARREKKATIPCVVLVFDLVGDARSNWELLTLMIALMTVTMPFTMAMKQLVIAWTTELKQDATAPIVAVLWVVCLFVDGDW
jgi:hypothetical protein